jgi:tripartite-type tricarboxylate transporter receptor subunit TctC
MIPGRRRFLRLAAAVAAVPAVARLAGAQSYPSRPVRLIVGFAPGGGNDIVARLIGQWLQERLGQPFVIDNRPGAGTNIATEAVAHAPADGYTLLLAGFPNATNATLYRNLKFDFIRDIAPVVAIIRAPNAMLVHPAVAATTVRDFIAYAKANPGRINMASAGVGSGSHLAGELFKLMAGIDLVHVPFRGNAPALTALLGGQVELQFATPASTNEYVTAGKLRALAVTSAERSQALPDVPAIGEFVPGYDMSAWYGIGTPAGAPAEAIGRINAEVNAALADPKIKEVLAGQGGIAIGGTPADFGRLIADETDKWAKVIRTVGIRLD